MRTREEREAVRRMIVDGEGDDIVDDGVTSVVGVCSGRKGRNEAGKVSSCLYDICKAGTSMFYVDTSAKYQLCKAKLRPILRLGGTSRTPRVRPIDTDPSLLGSVTVPVLVA